MSPSRTPGPWPKSQALPSERIRRAFAASVAGAPLDEWEFDLEDVAGLLAERDAAVAQLQNAVAPVLAGAKSAIAKIEAAAVNGAGEWAAESGFGPADVSNLVGAVQDAIAKARGGR